MASTDKSVPHTPGPWRVADADTWPFDICIVDAEDNLILKRALPAQSSRDKTLQDALDCVHFKADERQMYSGLNYSAVANAHLAASAPDLLAALEDVQGEIECRYDGAVDSNTLWLGRSLEIIDKAIKKARGEA